jgi:hypothetical protein
MGRAEGLATSVLGFASAHLQRALEQTRAHLLEMAAVIPQTRPQRMVTATEEITMALRFLGKDPDSPDGGSPTVYYDDERDTYVLQGWRVLDARRAQLSVPDHETVIEFPRRMMHFFPEVNGGGRADT